MRMNNFITGVGIFLSLLAAVSFPSCTVVALDGSEDMPDSVAVNITLNWPSDVTPADKPDTMCLAFSRIINTVHYVWQSDPSGTIFPEDSKSAGDDVSGGNSETGGEDGEGNGDTPENTSRDNVLPNGEYYMMVFNDISDTYMIESVDEFRDNPAVSMREIYAVVNELSEDEIPSGVADFNPAFGYLEASDPLFIDVKKQRIYPTVSPDIAFDIKRLTQKLTFRLSIRLQGNVTIENDLVTAEISGVPRRVQLMSAQVSDSTYRALFDMHKISQSGNVHVYQGEVNVLGLFPSGANSDIVGAGILQITIPALSPAADGTGTNKRLFHAGINLRETILGAALMHRLTDGTGYRIARSSALLQVNSVLEINEDQILPSGDSQGVEIWFDSEDNDIDIEV